MSSIARWSYKSVATIWQVVDRSDSGVPIFGAPYTIACSWEYGGDKRSDKNGQEFVPRSTFYFEAADGSALIPSNDDYIVRGDKTGVPTPPAEAEPIRRVGGWGMEMFGANEIPDWELNT